MAEIRELKYKKKFTYVIDILCLPMLKQASIKHSSITRTELY